MSGSSEGVHRTANRFRTGVRVAIGVGKGAIDCEAENISRTGLLLVGPLPMPADDRVELTVAAPSGNLEVRLVGRIIRAEMDPQAGLRMAIEFIELDDASRAGLEALLSEASADPAAGPFDHLKPNSPPPDIKKALEAILLPSGSRSRHAQGQEREILRLDSQPAVLDSLAKNPNLTLAEARSLAASTYLMPATLDALSSDLRFKDDEELRISVASILESRWQRPRGSRSISGCPSSRSSWRSPASTRSCAKSSSGNRTRDSRLALVNLRREDVRPFPSAASARTRCSSAASRGGRRRRASRRRGSSEASRTRRPPVPNPPGASAPRRRGSLPRMRSADRSVDRRRPGWGSRILSCSRATSRLLTGSSVVAADVEPRGDATLPRGTSRTSPPARRSSPPRAVRSNPPLRSAAGNAPAQVPEVPNEAVVREDRQLARGEMNGEEPVGVPAAQRRATRAYAAAR